MKKPITAYSEVAKRLEGSLDTIRILSEILISNGGYKPEGDNPAQIDDRGESGIQSAILIMASAAHRDFCQLATDMGIPE